MADSSESQTIHFRLPRGWASRKERSSHGWVTHTSKEKAFEVLVGDNPYPEVPGAACAPDLPAPVLAQNQDR